MSYLTAPIDSRAGRATILELWRRNLASGSARRYNWLYQEGPASSWLVASEAGRPLGSMGLMLRDIRSPIGLLRAGQATDLNVDQDHRSAGPALSLQRAVTAAVRQGRLDLIYGFPNDKALPVLRRIGYQPVGNFTRWVRPLASKELLRLWLCGTLPHKAASLAADCLLWLTLSQRRHLLPRAMRVCVSDLFDGRFDALWQEASPQFGFVGQRTSAYLNWRFGRCPDATHRVFYLEDEDSRVRAYLVYSRAGNTAYVSDFLFTDAAHFESLAAQFLRQMRLREVEIVRANCMAPSGVAQALRRLGFWKSPRQWPAMVYFDRRRLESLASRLTDAQSWFLTRADVDTDDR